MQWKFHIVLENVGGKLDETFSKTEEGIKSAMMIMLQGCDLRDGDVIRIIDQDPDRE